jgi:hypothetical protein
LLAYLASFFFLGSRHTLFYLLIALPGIFLLTDLRRLLQDQYRVPVSLVLVFVSYFALSSLWSKDGAIVDGAKLALCVICLMVTVHSTMNILSDSGDRIRRFILIAGSCSAIFFCVLFVGKMFVSGEYSSILSARYTLRALSGSGDNNPINTAIYFGVIVLAAWWTFPGSRPWTKLGLLLVTGASVTVMFLTQSRGPFLSLFVVLFTLSVFRRHRDDLMLWGIAAATGVAAVLWLDLIPSIMERAGSPNYRTGIWLHVIESIKDNLLFGRGFGDSADIPISLGNGGVVTVGHSHSSILETFRIGGLIGGVLFLTMVFSIAHRSLRKSPGGCFFVLWLFFGLLCLSTNGRLPLRRPSIEWFALWIPLFFVLFTPNETTAERQPVMIS